MALRAGIDLVSVEELRGSVETHGQAYLTRVYCDDELADCRSQEGIDIERLAARFAAKEAALKVLRPGSDQAVPWRAIELRRASTGWVELELHGIAAELARAAQLHDFAVSITHENGFAGAVVVAEVGG